MSSIAVTRDCFLVDDSIAMFFNSIRESTLRYFQSPELSMPGVKKEIVEDFRANGFDFSKVLADPYHHPSWVIYGTIENMYNEHLEVVVGEADSARVSFQNFWQDAAGRIWSQAFIKYNRLDLFKYFEQMGKPLPQVVGDSFQTNHRQYSMFSSMRYALIKKSFDCLEYFLIDLKLSDDKLIRELVALQVEGNTELLPLYRKLSLQLLTERSNEFIWRSYLREVAREAGNTEFVEQFDRAVAMWRENVWREFVNFPYTVWQILQDNPRISIALSAIFLATVSILYAYYHSRDRLVSVLTNRVRAKFKPAASARYFKNLPGGSLEIKYQRTLTNGHHQLSLHVKQGGLKPEAQAHLLRIVDKVIEAYFTPTKGYSRIYDNKPICGKSFTALPGGNGFKVDITLPSLWANSKKQNQALKRLKFQFRRAEQIKLQEGLKIRVEKALTWLQQRAESQKTARNSASPRIFQSVSCPQPPSKSTKKRSGPARHRSVATGCANKTKPNRHRKRDLRGIRNRRINDKQKKDRLAAIEQHQQQLKAKRLLERFAGLESLKDRLQELKDFEETSIGSLERHEHELTRLQAEIVELYHEMSNGQSGQNEVPVSAPVPAFRI